MLPYKQLHKKYICNLHCTKLKYHVLLFLFFIFLYIFFCSKKNLSNLSLVSYLSCKIVIENLQTHVILRFNSLFFSLFQTDAYDFHFIFFQKTLNRFFSFTLIFSLINFFSFHPLFYTILHYYIINLLNSTCINTCFLGTKQFPVSLFFIILIFFQSKISICFFYVNQLHL